MSLRGSYSAGAKTRASVSVVAGDLIWVGFFVDKAVATTTCADNAAGGSNTYNAVDAGCDGYTWSIYSFYAIAKATETLTITITTANTGTYLLDVHVESNCDPTLANVLDGFAQKRDASSATAHTTGNVVTTNAIDAMISFWVQYDTGATLTENGTGFTRVLGTGSGTFNKDTAATGTINQATTSSAGVRYTSYLMAFKRYTFTAAAAFTQAIQTLAVSASETFSDATAETQSIQTISIAGTVTYAAAVALNQAIQTINVVDSVRGTVALAQAVQTLAVAGSMTSDITGSVAFSQIKNAIAVAASETFSGSVAFSQAIQTVVSSDSTMLRKAYCTEDSHIQAGVAVTVGDLIIVVTYAQSAIHSTSCADNAAGGSNTYEQIGTGQELSGAEIHIFKAIAKATEVLTIQWTSLSVDSEGIYVHVVIGAEQDHDQLIEDYTFGLLEGTAVKDHTSESVTITTRGYLFVVWAQAFAGGTFSENGTGFTEELELHNIVYMATYDRNVDAAGTYADTVKSTSSIKLNSFIAAFRAKSIGFYGTVALSQVPQAISISAGSAGITTATVALTQAIQTINVAAGWAIVVYATVDMVQAVQDGSYRSVLLAAGIADAANFIWANIPADGYVEKFDSTHYRLHGSFLSAGVITPQLQRISWDGTQLLYPTVRTNKCPFSEAQDNAVYSNTGSALGTGIADPAGGTKAFTVTADSPLDVFFTSVPGISSPNVTPSFWMRRRTGTSDPHVMFTIAGGLFYTIKQISSSWQRFNNVCQPWAGMAYCGLRIPQMGDAVDVAFFQIEDGIVATPNIITPDANPVSVLDYVLGELPTLNTYGKEIFQAAVATSQSVQTIGSSNMLLFAASVSFQQAIQEHSIAGAETFQAIFHSSQEVQSISFAGGETFICSIAESQAIQAMANVSWWGYPASIAFIQHTQSIAIVAAETLTGSIATIQVPNSTQANTSLVFTSVTATSQVPQQASASGQEQFTAAAAINQSIQSISFAGKEDLFGSVGFVQAIQAINFISRMTFVSTATTSQVPQTTSSNALLVFRSVTSIAQAIQSMSSIGFAGFYGSATTTQVAQRIAGTSLEVFICSCEMIQEDQLLDAFGVESFVAAIAMQQVVQEISTDTELAFESQAITSQLNQFFAVSALEIFQADCDMQQAIQNISITSHYIYAEVRTGPGNRNYLQSTDEVRNYEESGSERTYEVTP